MTGSTKPKMKTQIFIRLSQKLQMQYIRKIWKDRQTPWRCNVKIPLLVLVLPRIMAGMPAADDSTQMITLMILALTGVRKSRALMGWHTAT
ncbi:hypothetical protein EYF80_010958 [Liparis tanakae]|uniref:Uncharacterized protein n=1 Tax=Liparis tanakae TaxID=230148 RepID=A0A4Z2IM36_9TELE|nr:hypothetical protein EYF80_010958 [Liparis tanakae]